MATAEIISAALFCFLMVFALLCCLFGLIKLTSIIVRYLENKVKKQEEAIE